MKIGIVAQGFIDWGGGVDFLRTVSSSLQFAAPDIEQHVLVPSSGPRATVAAVREQVKRVLGRPTNARHRPQWAHVARTFEETRATIHAIDMGAAALASAGRRLGLDVVLPSIVPLPRTFSLPWIGYLFDFQHKRLPHFFSDVERANRDVAFASMLASAQSVIVNAQDVVDDIRHFYPELVPKLFALPFSAAPGSDWFEQDPATTARRYGLEQPYFIVCNQFWKHKDHDTAFRAFASIARQRPAVLLACTGATNDYRHPRHFEELMSFAQREGIAARIRILGMVPKLDQVALIRGSIALIQPTLFEGGPGGGAVYDAVSMGALSIVSDLPVNRELNEPTVSYFEAANAESLAAKMDEAIANGSGLRAAPAELLREGHARRVQCGHRILEAIDFAMNLSK